MRPLIRPSGTFSRQEGREKALVARSPSLINVRGGCTIAFSRPFRREKVPEGRMRGSDDS